MRKVFAILIILIVAISCRRTSNDSGERIITVSIAPYEYFVKQIGGSDFEVNIMVPPGANPHIYEPYPGQITKLAKSVAYISNGYMGFEMTWLDRFYEMNKSMVKLSLGDKITPIASEHVHEGEHTEGTDPHYWVSPKCAAIMASEVKKLLCNLNPQDSSVYQANYERLAVTISETDKKAKQYFSGIENRTFMIYHPNLAYLARDYNLEEVAVEFEGKEPPPSRLKELIDLARGKGINTVFVQREYDSKNAKAIAREIGAEVAIIDPLSADWLKSTTEILEALKKSLIESKK